MADFVEKSYFCTHHISSKGKEIVMDATYTELTIRLSLALILGGAIGI